MSLDHRLESAQAKRLEWCILPPAVNHPLPAIGWRLFQFRPELPPAEYYEKWVEIQRGSQQVMERLCEQLNKDNQGFKLAPPKTVRLPHSEK